MTTLLPLDSNFNVLPDTVMEKIIASDYLGFSWPASDAVLHGNNLKTIGSAVLHTLPGPPRT